MRTCPSCGQQNAEGFNFCGNCGAALATPTAAREQRKTVTVLFCDVTGSTALGESTDPEALRALLARYFERMKGIVESHGGTVEKFIGDAVMAVFGVPVVHEDDALRACRAAVEMREALPELGVQARIGVNTGEVVTGTQERLATGDAVNVAARLEQAAQPDEILIGAETLQLVSDTAETEPVEPLELKGKAEAVSALRLLSIEESAERRHETPFVGRAPELEALREAWQRASQANRCELVTVVGDAGVGKSRLALAFLAGIEARVVRGRCLPYGEGITYWPVVEALKQLDGLPSDPAAAASIRSLLGETEQGTSADEIAWAFRKLLEEHAPLIVVFDDIQWAEETFLDLVEHVALLSSAAPILLLCLGRPDFAEDHPHWPISLRLEPLLEADVDELIPEATPEDLCEKIRHAAGGNPLFVTEMVAMAIETKGEVMVPSTLQALLATRLDQLKPMERSVLQRGAVEGEVFHRGSVQALSEDEQVAPRLASLVRKELIRPEKAQLPAEDAFRFRHLLIRDTAYDALPKAMKAKLHERFADWLEHKGKDLVELDEILGYHFEQAARNMEELGKPDPKLAERAGERLTSAGRRALWRGDLRAAAALLERALALIRPSRLDVSLELDLADAQSTRQEAIAAAESVAERARLAGNQVGEMVANVVAADRRSILGNESVDELEALARNALPLLEQAGDHAGLMHVWFALGAGVANVHGRFEEWGQAAEHAIRNARLAGQRRWHLFGLEMALWLGPRPADEALRILDRFLPEHSPPRPLLNRACLVAMLGRFEEAWKLARKAAARDRELSGESATACDLLAEIAKLDGDHASAADELHAFCEMLERRGDRGFLACYAPNQGRSLCMLGRFAEAEPLAQLGRELGDEQDVWAQALWRQVQALVLAHRGERTEAENLAREAVAITERTDGLNWQGDAICDLAEVLHAAGRTDEAAEALEQALERYGRKKNLAMVAQVHPRLDELRAGVT